jgi:hypothetical protein
MTTRLYRRRQLMMGTKFAYPGEQPKRDAKEKAAEVKAALAANTVYTPDPADVAAMSKFFEAHPGARKFMTHLLMHRTNQMLLESCLTDWADESPADCTRFLTGSFQDQIDEYEIALEVFDGE